MLPPGSLHCAPDTGRARRAARSSPGAAAAGRRGACPLRTSPAYGRTPRAHPCRGAAADAGHRRRAAGGRRRLGVRGQVGRRPRARRRRRRAAARVTSRNGNDVTGVLPRARRARRGARRDAGAARRRGGGASTRAGAPTSAALQSRMHVTRPSAVRCAATRPVQLLRVRRAAPRRRDAARPALRRAARAARGTDAAGRAWQMPPSFPGDGAAVLEATRAQGLEGVVAKRRDAATSPGRRSDDWRKVKHVRRHVAVVGGWKPGEGGARRAPGLAAARPPRRRRAAFAGHVGTGFTAATLATLGEQLKPLAARARRSPTTCRASTRAAPYGSSRRWSPRSSSPSGRGTAGCGTRRTRGCATTWRRGRPRGEAASTKVAVDVDGRQLTLSNLDKVLYPEVGFTKAAGHRLLHTHRAGAAAAPRGRAADAQALPGRRRGAGLLREERAARHARRGSGR